MQILLRCRRLQWVLVGLLLSPAFGTKQLDDIGEVRRAATAFLSGLQHGESQSRMLRWFAAEAFTNPVTRQVTAFTGGDFNASPIRIREYVAETLKAATPTANVDQRCPDPTVVAEDLLSGLKPDNDPKVDGFQLKRIDRQVLKTIETETNSVQPQVAWLRSQIQHGRPLVAMTVACNGVPLITIWQRTKPGHWLIVAFAVALP